MGKLKQKIHVRANGKLRNLVSITENSKGDVYMRLQSGAQIGIPPNAIQVKQDRFSIHYSPNSDTYITLKRTLELENGYFRTSAALTDSVKKKNGFSSIFAYRSTDLAARIYDVPTESRQDIEIGGFDPARSALIFCAFVGHPDSIFSYEPYQEEPTIIRSKHFQIVFVYTLISIPALPFAWTLTTITHSPELFDDDAGRTAAYMKMSGETPSACAELFDAFVNRLALNLLETYRTILTDEQSQQEIDQLIKSIPPMASFTF